MKINVSDTPAKEAGEHICRIISEHDGDVLCLLSGGSALDVVEYINIDADTQKKQKSECRTIFMMGDERVSGEPEVNNFLQLQARYGDSPVTACTIPTVPEVNESSADFATRIEKIFLEKISQLENLKIISILGIGADGHTAGIFPMTKESFAKVYGGDSVYVPVHAEGLKIDSRASFTPKWLLSHVDAVVGYVTGESKKMMLESLQNEQRELWERPAELFKRHPEAHLYTDIVV